MEDVIGIGSRREIFVDDFLIHELDGVDLRLQNPVPAGISVNFDAPWEGLFAGCITVLQDDGRFLMYYRGMPEVQANGCFDCACVAISNDGIEWEKPSLGLYEFNGSTDNNIVLTGHGAATHNFCPFKDTRPGVPDEERFKALGGTHPGGIHAFMSPDGIRWSPMSHGPILTSETFAFDSQNVAFWSESEGCYVSYFRTFRKRDGGELKHGHRWVSRSTSHDFRSWSDFEEMEDGGAPWEETYTQQTHPYFRAPHIYISLAARFWPKRKVVSDEGAAAVGVHPSYSHDCSDTVLMTSRGGNRYVRTFLESFVRPGIGANNWISRTNYCGIGVIQTGDNEMSLFAHRHYASPSAHAARYTLRLDGFSSISAPFAGGEFLTKPFTFTGRSLVLNYSTSAAGSVRCELLSADGQPVSGFSMKDADEIVGDEIERTVSWQGVTDVSELAGKPIRARFVMKDSDLFAIQFK